MWYKLKNFTWTLYTKIEYIWKNLDQTYKHPQKKVGAGAYTLNTKLKKKKGKGKEKQLA